MIQLIGLIIIVYAMVRLFQVPFEHASYETSWLGMPFWARALLVTVSSCTGLLLLFFFLLLLLFFSEVSY